MRRRAELTCTLKPCLKMKNIETKGVPVWEPLKLEEKGELLNLLKSVLAIIIPNRRLVFSQNTEDRLAYVCQSSNETTDKL